jgi:hypothetical protein
MEPIQEYFKSAFPECNEKKNKKVHTAIDA